MTRCSRSPGVVRKIHDPTAGTGGMLSVAGEWLHEHNPKARLTMSNIRQYLLESDLVEAIIALPTDMFYNTGISTYLWVVTNKKTPARKGKLQLIDASSFWQMMRKTLGSKRKELSPEHVEEITRLFCEFKDVRRPDADGTIVPISLIFPNENFGYRTFAVEWPLKWAATEVARGERDAEIGYVSSLYAEFLYVYH